MKVTLKLVALTSLTLATAVSATEVFLGEVQTFTHLFSGSMYALSESVLEVRNMVYDGLGPNAFFWANTGTTLNSAGYRLFETSPVTSCGSDALPKASGETFRFEFPEGLTLNDFAGGRIGIWCIPFSANFGHVEIPTDLSAVVSTSEGPAKGCASQGVVADAPAPVPAPVPVPATSADEIFLGVFNGRTHRVTGEVYALSDRVLEVRNWGYDGIAIATFFWASPAAIPQDEGGFVMYDHEGCGVTQLEESNGGTIRMEFPEDSGMTLNTLADVVGSISVWCIPFDANFGEIVFDSNQLDLTNLAIYENLQGPPLECQDNIEGFPLPGAETDDDDDDGAASVQIETPGGFNCEELNDDFRVRWKVENGNLLINLLGRIDEDIYMGFGVSGEPDAAQMLGADPVVADFFDGGFRARDYYLSSRAQCSQRDGACPDEDGFTDDVDASLVTGARADGFTEIQYVRLVAPADSGAEMSGFAVDQTIDVTPGVSTPMIWALGPVDPSSGNPFFHSIDFSRDVTFIEFGRPTADNCGAFSEVDAEPEVIVPFFRPIITDTTEFRAVIGPSGGPRGFASISGGLTAWGIAWFLNDILIPVVEMRRGTTYKFIVSGGNDQQSSSEFHPFYLTSSTTGGYVQLTPLEKAEETIYAGINIVEQTPQDGVIAFEPTAVAPICDYLENPDSSEAAAGGFPFYFSTLDLETGCDPSTEESAAELTFTPDETTPDVIYYQCVTHTNLGWKIHVIDADAPSILDVDCSAMGSTPIQLTGAYSMNVIVDPVRGVLEAELIYKGNGWVGMAFTDGTPIMIGGQAVIGLPDEGTVMKYDLNARARSGVVPMSEERQTLMNTTITQSGGQTIMRFTKLMIEEGEHPIFEDKKNTFLFAHGSGNTLAFHQGFGNVEFIPNQCAVSVLGEIQNPNALDRQGFVGVDTPDLNRPLWLAHGACAATAWAILVPLAIGASLVRKVLVKLGLPKPAWFWVHRGLNMLAAILTLIAFSLAVHAINDQTPDGESAEHFSRITHHKTGLSIFIMTMAQAINGILRPHLPHPPADDDDDDEVKKDSDKPEKASAVPEKSVFRKFWEVFHRLLGAALLGLTWWQVQDGLELFSLRFGEENIDYIFWIVISCIGGVVIALGAYQRIALCDE